MDMYTFDETELTGIGRSFTVQTHTGTKIVIVVHDLGDVELYYSTPNEPEKMNCLGTLHEDEARLLAAIIGRTIYRPEAIERLAHHGVLVSWYRVKPGSFAAGRKIGEIIREGGVAVIAVIDSDGQRIVDPPPSHLLEVDAQIALAASVKQVPGLKRLFD